MLTWKGLLKCSVELSDCWNIQWNFLDCWNIQWNFLIAEIFNGTFWLAKHSVELSDCRNIQWNFLIAEIFDCWNVQWNFLIAEISNGTFWLLKYPIMPICNGQGLRCRIIEAMMFRTFVMLQSKKIYDCSKMLLKLIWKLHWLWLRINFYGWMWLDLDIFCVCYTGYFWMYELDKEIRQRNWRDYGENQMMIHQQMSHLTSHLMSHQLVQRARFALRIQNLNWLLILAICIEWLPFGFLLRLITRARFHFCVNHLYWFTCTNDCNNKLSTGLIKPLSYIGIHWPPRNYESCDFDLVDTRVHQAVWVELEHSLLLGWFAGLFFCSVNVHLIFVLLQLRFQCIHLAFPLHCVFLPFLHAVSTLLLVKLHFRLKLHTQREWAAFIKDMGAWDIGDIGARELTFDETNEVFITDFTLFAVLARCIIGGWFQQPNYASLEGRLACLVTSFSSSSCLRSLTWADSAAALIAAFASMICLWVTCRAQNSWDRFIYI